MALVSMTDIAFLEKCLNFLEKRELSPDLYLSSGSKKNIDKIIKMNSKFDEKKIRLFDSNDIASFVKHFLSSLNEPLISEQCRQYFIDFGSIMDHKKIKKLVYTTFSLEKSSRMTLCLLLEHFNKLSIRFGSQWTMSVAHVFSPTLFFSQNDLSDGKIFRKNDLVNSLPQALKFFIENYKKVYHRYESLLPLEEKKVAFIFLSRCLTEIEDRGLDMCGIYRVEGAKKNTNSLLSFSKNRYNLNKLILSEWNINTISAAIKNYISNMEEPLLTINVVDEIIRAVDLDSSDEIQNILCTLPEFQRKLLQMLLKHLTLVLDYKEENQMPLENLSIVFAPTIFQISETEKLEDCRRKVNFLISNYHKIFRKWEEETAREKYRCLPFLPETYI